MECKHVPRYYKAPDDIYAAGFDGKSNGLYRCKLCGMYIYQSQPWKAWQLAPDRFQDLKRTKAMKETA